jgi:glucose/arabinose dehydrogenase
MKKAFWLALVILGMVDSTQAGDKLPKPMITGLKNPESVAIGFNGRVFISEIGEFNKDGDGRVLEVKDGKAVPFATGLDDPKGMAFWQKWLFVTDKTRVWRIDAAGKAEVYEAAEAFPTKPQFLNDMVVDERGMLYLSDSGDLKGSGGVIFRIDPKGKVTLVTDGKRTPQLKVPNGLVMDGMAHLLLLDFGSGELLRIKIADGRATKLAEGFDGGDGLAWDYFGRLFITSWKQGKVWGIARPGDNPVLLASGLESAADSCLDAAGKFLLVPDMKAGTLMALPTTIPGYEVDESPLALKPEVAFPNLKWTGWQGFTEEGKIFQLRNLYLTHAGDGSQRNFVPIQQGTIHVFPNDPKAEKTKIFLDIQKKVFYDDKENEQGLLGLAFHPHYKKNGEFFVFYTLRQKKLTNVLCRYRVSKDDPDRADPASEEEILRIDRPFWNHDGGTICFGPDGYLYLAIGDGGSANDPHKNGPNLKTLLAKVLRIDVDHKDPGKNYAIPKDNPFVDRTDALPEIWAYGFRNIWRMAFDRKTGKLWAGDVGQNLYEEIDIVVKGGNYGWSIREALHPFSEAGVGSRSDLIDPIWEYHHDIGKSITGGVVYRGKRLPELEGHYLYADYISGRIWALHYDEAKKRVVANRPLQGTKDVIVSFGEDEQGEVYFMAPNVSGKGIFRFERSGANKK